MFRFLWVHLPSRQRLLGLPLAWTQGLPWNRFSGISQIFSESLKFSLKSFRNLSESLRKFRERFYTTKNSMLRDSGAFLKKPWEILRDSERMSRVFWEIPRKVLNEKRGSKSFAGAFSSPSAMMTATGSVAGPRVETVLISAATEISFCRGRN